MTGFSTDWLALREPFDRAAREASAAALDLGVLALRLRAGAPMLRVLDLACGTGANLRELAPRLGGSQRWLLVDHDPRLLAALPEAFGAWARAQGFALRADADCLRIEGPDWDAEVRTRCIDLVMALDAVPFDEAQLVTASALLDLVSASWLDALLVHMRAVNAAMLFALNVDGRVNWEPAIAADAQVHELFAAHQRRDKGFGAALGGEAVALAVARMEAMGYDVMLAQSDWRIEEPAMLRAMVEGTAAAAVEQEPAAHALVRAWKSQRLALVERNCLCVGHRDILATL